VLGGGALYRVHCETCHKDLGSETSGKKMARAFKERHVQDHPDHVVRIFLEALPRMGR